MRVSLIIICLLWRGLAFGAFVLDQTSAQQDIAIQVSPWVFSYTSPPTAGAVSIITGMVGNFGGSYPTCTVDDDQSNVYTVVQPSVGIGEAQALIAYSIGIAANTSQITVSCTNGNYAELRAMAFTGSSIAVDQSGEALDAGPQASDATVSTTGAVTGSSQLIVASAAICASATNDMQIVTPGGFTDSVISQDCFNYWGANSVYKIATGVSGVQTVNWSHLDITGSTAYDAWQVLIVTFKETAAPVLRRKATILE